jgi:antitoxin component of RelBE/YafQ-DinJ toxin-antitoxin module
MDEDEMVEIEVSQELKSRLEKVAKENGLTVEKLLRNFCDDVSS